MRSAKHKSRSRTTPVFSTDKPYDSTVTSVEAVLAYQQKWVGFPELASVKCPAAFSKSGKNAMFAQHVTRVPVKKYLSDSSDCRRFRKVHGFERYPKVSREELAFPIAFILLFNKDFDQVIFEIIVRSERERRKKGWGGGGGGGVGLLFWQGK